MSKQICSKGSDKCCPRVNNDLWGQESRGSSIHQGVSGKLCGEVSSG